VLLLYLLLMFPYLLQPPLVDQYHN